MKQLNEKIKGLVVKVHDEPIEKNRHLIYKKIREETRYSLYFNLDIIDLKIDPQKAKLGQELSLEFSKREKEENEFQEEYEDDLLKFWNNEVIDLNFEIQQTRCVYIY